MSVILDVIRDTNIELVIQGCREIDWSNASSHILCGADMLNRGFTIENLSVTYMPRYNIGKSTADTIQQRCRFFGYKQKYLDVCRVYLPTDSILEYVDYVEHEEIMRSWLKEKETLEQVEQVLLLDEKMNATRNNILSVNVVRNKLSGWRQMNALQNIDENIAFVEDYLNRKDFKPYKEYGTIYRNHRYVKVDIQEAINFLKDFKLSNMPDALRKSSTMQYLKYLAKEKKISHVYIIQMAFDNIDGRERKFDKETLRIDNIFAGPDPKGKDIYPGDKGIFFSDSLCIQIHKIKLKHPSIEWGNKVCYTLGLYYPEEFAHTFIGVTN